MNTLNHMLGAIFKQTGIRKDAFRKAREEAKKLAAQHGVEIERLRDGGFNVWPPKSMNGEDPYEGDHYANDWDDVVVMVRKYAV